MLSRDEAGKGVESAAANHVVVETATKIAAAILGHLQPTAQCAEGRYEVLEEQRAVCDALHLQVMRLGSEVVQEQHRALLSREVLLERQDLTAVPERVSGQQSQLRQRIEHQA